MSADLGATTYTAVVWTAGDTITEAKMDSMVANDQAYDSHDAQGLLLDNNKSFAGKTTGAANRNLIKLSASDRVVIGDTDLAEHIKAVQGTYQDPETYTPAGAATATLDLNKGNEHRITMPAGNITIAISNEIDGQKFVVSITQDGTGSRTVTWFSTIKWVNGVAPTLTTTASKRDTFVFICTGVDTYDGFIVGLNK